MKPDGIKTRSLQRDVRRTGLACLGLNVGAFGAVLAFVVWLGLRDRTAGVLMGVHFGISLFLFSLADRLRIGFRKRWGCDPEDVKKDLGW